MFIILSGYGIHQRPIYRKIAEVYESGLLGINKNLQHVGGFKGTLHGVTKETYQVTVSLQVYGSCLSRSHTF